MKFKWELLNFNEIESHETLTVRAKVFGGWIVKTNKIYSAFENYTECQSMVFVPDEHHRWEIEKE